MVAAGFSLGSAATMAAVEAVEAPAWAGIHAFLNTAAAGSRPETSPTADAVVPCADNGFDTATTAAVAAGEGGTEGKDLEATPPQVDIPSPALLHVGISFGPVTTLAAVEETVACVEDR